MPTHAFGILTRRLTLMSILVATSSYAIDPVIVGENLGYRSKFLRGLFHSIRSQTRLAFMPPADGRVTITANPEGRILLVEEGAGSSPGFYAYVTRNIRGPKARYDVLQRGDVYELSPRDWGQAGTVTSQAIENLKATLVRFGERPLTSRFWRESDWHEQQLEWLKAFYVEAGADFSDFNRFDQDLRVNITREQAAWLRRLLEQAPLKKTRALRTFEPFGPGFVSEEPIAEMDQLWYASREVIARRRLEAWYGIRQSEGTLTFGARLRLRLHLAFSRFWRRH